MQAILDHGYVKLIESWGSDERVIESARMSTRKGFLGWGPFCSKCGIRMVKTHEGIGAAADYERGEQRGCDHDIEKLGDEKLLRFLYENKHATPFEFAGMTIEVQAPIFVFREWHRHRTQSYNEMSARYVPLPDVNYYIPSVERLTMQGGTNKQATSTGATLNAETAHEAQRDIAHLYREAQATYEELLCCGAPKELARLVIPVGRYSRMRATANLRNWLAFLILREAPNAQWEIRQYAHAVGALIKEKFPRTHALYAETTR